MLITLLALTDLQCKIFCHMDAECVMNCKIADMRTRAAGVACIEVGEMEQTLTGSLASISFSTHGRDRLWWNRPLRLFFLFLRLLIFQLLLLQMELTGHSGYQQLRVPHLVCLLNLL